LKHKDPTVRRVAVQLMGKKCDTAPRNLWLLVQMWSDKNGKVKKEVMDVFGDFGKRHKDQVPSILTPSFVEDINSIIVWRNLSLSWQQLIPSPGDSQEGGSESNTSNSDEDVSSPDQSAD